MVAGVGFDGAGQVVDAEVVVLAVQALHFHLHAPEKSSREQVKQRVKKRKRESTFTSTPLKSEEEHR